MYIHYNNNTQKKKGKADYLKRYCHLKMLDCYVS